MKTLKQKKVLAVFLSALMLIGTLPLSVLGGKAEKVKAETATYVLNASDLTVGNFESGVALTDYFTLNLAASVDANNKTSDAGDSFTQRLKLKKNTDGSANGSVDFVVKGDSAKVTVYAMSGSSSNDIDLGVYDAEGNVVGTTATAYGKVTDNVINGVTFDIAAAGSYSIRSTSTVKGLNIYKVVVEETKEVQPVETEYVLNASDLTVGNFESGAALTDYFTLNLAASVDANNKTSDAGDSFTQRLKLKKNTDGSANGSVDFVVKGDSAKVTVYAMSGSSSNDIDLGVYDAEGNVVGTTATAYGKVTDNVINGVTFDIAAAGSYSIRSTSTVKGLNIYKVVVKEISGGSSEVKRADWSSVAAPVITSAVQNGEKIDVTVDCLIGNDGADKVVVTETLLDGTTKELTSKKEGTSVTLSFSASESGTYKFTATASRDGEETTKTSAEATADFALPLTAPNISSVTSAGNGKISVVWAPVTEATSYEVSYAADGTDAFSAPVEVTDTAYTATGLTVGTRYNFKVVAKRANPEAASEAGTGSAIATADAKQVWSFSAFGQGVSLDSKNAGSEGNPNEGDGSVRVYAVNGKGKLVPASTDGLSFYYTAVPADKNYTLEADVKVNSWTYSNGQEGFGLMAADAVGTSGDASQFWNNSYMATVSKVEYYAADGQVADAGDKISMKLGVGSQEKIGVTKENLDNPISSTFSTAMKTLETSQARAGAGTYNIVGGRTQAECTGITDAASDKVFHLKIQKNNTGYFVSYTNAAGQTVTNKYYNEANKANLGYANVLGQLDAENEYVGVFAARNCDVTASNINLTVINPEDDAPAEGLDVTYVTPNYQIVSESTSNSEDYALEFMANADGHVVATNEAGETVLDADVKANEKVSQDVKLAEGKNTFSVTMTPNPDYAPAAFSRLSSYDAQTLTATVLYQKVNGDYVFVGPEGSAKADGTRVAPLDLQTALKYAQPGQKIVLLDGTYNLTSTLKVPRGTNGTEEAPITLMADTESESRPVLDFGKVSEGVVAAGDYWYFQGFDVTNTTNGKDGFRLAGSYNVVDNCNFYNNGNTGLQISRYMSSDAKSEWPHDNLILNCTSHNNADAGYEDADGFAAKLTIGENNVFDGCIAHNNADDGWDLFAKPETGSIGAVTIKNCVAYANGYLEDGTNAGNGNGFKMGGSSITGKHHLINSVAFDNKAKGIDSNSCPDIIVDNSTTFNNASFNVAFYTNDAKNTDFVANGILSYRTWNKETSEQFKFKGTQDESKVYNASNYFWIAKLLAEPTSTYNNSNGLVEDDWFERVDTYFDYDAHVYAQAPIGRNADNTIDMMGLLVKTDKAASEAGAVMTGTASKKLELPTNAGEGNTQNLIPDTTEAAKTGVNTYAIALLAILMMISGFAMLAVTVKKRA